MKLEKNVEPNSNKKRIECDHEENKMSSTLKNTILYSFRFTLLQPEILLLYIKIANTKILLCRNVPSQLEKKL